MIYFLFDSIGSGKTSLFHAIISDMKIDLTSSVSILGNISYVPQKSWILNDTVRNNIIFNNDFEEERYKQVLEVSCLEHDLTILDNSDQTMIGKTILFFFADKKIKSYKVKKVSTLVEVKKQELILLEHFIQKMI